jgi:hypothetical protein
MAILLAKKLERLSLKFFLHLFLISTGKAEAYPSGIHSHSQLCGLALKLNLETIDLAENSCKRQTRYLFLHK